MLSRVLLWDALFGIQVSKKRGGCQRRDLESLSYRRKGGQAGGVVVVIQWVNLNRSSSRENGVHEKVSFWKQSRVGWITGGGRKKNRITHVTSLTSAKPEPAVYHSANNPVKSGITAHFLVSSLLSREWSVPTLPLDLVGLVGLRRDVRSVPPGLSSTCWWPLEGRHQHWKTYCNGTMTGPQEL